MANRIESINNEKKNPPAIQGKFVSFYVNDKMWFHEKKRRRPNKTAHHPFVWQPFELCVDFRGFIN